MTPPSLYERSKDLETYFDGNPDAWFAGDAYGPWRAQLRGMGVRGEVELRVRKADLFGHVVVVTEFARHERGIDGFDPGAEFDGLDFALSHPGHARSEYIWNALLVPRRQLVAGVVETATRQEYQDARQERVLSVMGALATDAAWLPGADGTFRRPGELQLDDLPPAFERDEGLARSLGMVQARWSRKLPASWASRPACCAAWPGTRTWWRGLRRSWGTEKDAAGPGRWMSPGPRIFLTVLLGP